MYRRKQNNHQHHQCRCVCENCFLIFARIICMCAHVLEIAALASYSDTMATPVCLRICIMKFKTLFWCMRIKLRKSGWNICLLRWATAGQMLLEKEQVNKQSLFAQEGNAPPKMYSVRQHDLLTKVARTAMRIGFVIIILFSEIVFAFGWLAIVIVFIFNYLLYFWFERPFSRWAYSAICI